MFTFKNTYPFILILFFLSCSRNNKPPVKNCRIIAATTASGPSTATFTFEYKADGKLSRFVYKGSYTDTVTYSYSGNKVYRAVAAGIYSSVDTLTVNEGGFVLHDKTVTSNAVYNTDYVYDANGQLSSYTQQQDSYPPISANYVFTNGDNTLSTGSDGSKDTLAYDLSKLAVNGNLDQFGLLQLGGYTIKNKHLLISSKHGTTETYSYQFDADGNISSITSKINNITQTTTYTYSCQ